MVDIIPFRAEKVAMTIKDNGGEAQAIVADVTDSRAVQMMVRRALGDFKKIDILVNNAGGTVGIEGTGIEGVPFYKSREEDWDKILNLNLKSVLFCTRAVIEKMIERRSGKIINIASVAGLLGLTGSPIYSTAKGGVISFTRVVAKEVAPFGITVNSIAPTLTKTDAADRLSMERFRRFASQIPVRRVGKPKDVAEAALFLASDSSNFITGSCICVDGGRTLR